MHFRRWRNFKLKIKRFSVKWAILKGKISIVVDQRINGQRTFQQTTEVVPSSGYKKNILPKNSDCICSFALWKLTSPEDNILHFIKCIFFSKISNFFYEKNIVCLQNFIFASLKNL